MGTFVQHLEAVIVMGKTKVQELKEVFFLNAGQEKTTGVVEKDTSR